MMKNHCFLAGLLVAGLLVPGYACGQTSGTDKLRALFGNEVIARGQGFEIDQGKLDESVITIRASAAARGSAITPEALRELEREVLKRLINIELLKLRATDEDREKGKAEAQRRIDLLVERAGSEAAMVRQLMAVDLTLERLRDKLIEEATAEATLQRELNVQVTDEDIRTYYEENPARFERPEQLRAAHILLRTRDASGQRELPEDQKAVKRRQMESLLEQARKGEDFAALAREHSEDQASRERGGEYTFARGQMVPEFEAAAFSLAPGRVSDIVTSTFGFHIIKLYERIPAGMIPLDENVVEEVRTALRTQRMTRDMDGHMKKLAEAAKVEVLAERYQPITWDPPAAAP